MNKRAPMTREEALQKHREMWTAMQEELGDNPTLRERIKFKIEWCEQHDGDYIDCHCYLCQYVRDHGLRCSGCPIDWGGGCAFGSHTRYDISPISEIIALPERRQGEGNL